MLLHCIVGRAFAWSYCIYNESPLTVSKDYLHSSIFFLSGIDYIARKSLNEYLKSKKDHPKAVFMFAYSLSNQFNKQ